MNARAIVILGEQRFEPTLGDAVRELGVSGTMATVTAGWQEREAEDQELQEHLHGGTINLRLHRRAEEVFAEDSELLAGHRAKQAVLRHKQDFYRVRLEHALDANHVIHQRQAPPEILVEEEAASLAAIRALDEYHLGQCERVDREFDAAFRPLERPSIARHRREIAAILRDCAAVGIAGGHVATLLNRLRLFGIDQLVEQHAVFAWSAGAMAISERVVLFHDSPPQGPGVAEVLEGGLALLRGVVPLPQPETRLRLKDPERVQVMNRRFAPARCLALPARSYVVFKGGSFVRSTGVIELNSNGSHTTLSTLPHGV